MWAGYDTVVAGIDGWQAQLDAWGVTTVVVEADDTDFAARLTADRLDRAAHGCRRLGLPAMTTHMTTRDERLRPALTAAFAIGGYAFTIALLVVGFSNKQWPFPGGDVVDYYAPVGDRLREGLSIYPPEFLVTPPGFLYGPPWAVAFASVSWLGAGAIHAVILALDLVALWTIAWGDWRRLGYLLWFPLVAFELAAGQVNLIIAAALVAAQRGIVWPLAIVSFAKVWPALALPLRYWRPFLIALGLVALVTLPWLYLWPQWVTALLDAAPHPLGPVIPIPWLAEPRSPPPSSWWPDGPGLERWPR